MRRVLNGVATWFGTLQGFLATQSICILFALAGYFCNWSDRWMNGFTLFLSIAAYTMAGIILVANAKSERALQAKLDTLIKGLDKADDALIGIEQQI